MRHMQTQRLDDVGPVFEVERMAGVGVGRKQFAGLGQFVDVVEAVLDVGGVTSGRAA